VSCRGVAVTLVGRSSWRKRIHRAAVRRLDREFAPFHSCGGRVPFWAAAATM